MSDLESIESELNSQELSLKREKEIERTISAFTLDPYQILELDHNDTLTSNQIKKQYRSKSLLVHPDKTSNPNASKAFSLLKKAESNLQDQDYRAQIDEVYQLAKTQTQSTDPQKIYDTFKDILIQQEFTKRLNQQKELKKQGELAKLKEEQLELNELKQKFKKQWEENQDNRVNNWRSYSNKVTKKKPGKGKGKKKVLA